MSKPTGWFFTDDPQVVAMPGSGFFPGSTPPNDAINLVPLYSHPDPRVAELEAVLRECREVLMHYQYGGSNYKKPADEAIAKIDEVLVMKIESALEKSNG